MGDKLRSYKKELGDMSPPLPLLPPLFSFLSQRLPLPPLCAGKGGGLKVKSGGAGAGLPAARPGRDLVLNWVDPAGRSGGLPVGDRLLKLRAE